MSTSKYTYLRFLWLFIALFILPAWACADNAQLTFVPESTESPGHITLVIDKAAKIAGLKISVNYDKNQLQFVEAKRSKATSSFLHVVNDKTPGKLIIVMASAKGISGDNVPLLHLTFEILKADNKQQNSVSVTQVQLMTEDLKEIKANLPEYQF